MRIQHNIPAMNAYGNYTKNTKALQLNLQKLSSGYKINKAGDDAAGLAISEKMRAQITGLEVAQKNAKDGISLVQTAEGAMTEIHTMLNRMFSLAEQSANGTYDDDVDRVQLNNEFDKLRTEIDRIADASNFNGVKLLDGSVKTDTTATIPTDGTGNDTAAHVTGVTTSRDTTATNTLGATTAVTVTFANVGTGTNDITQEQKDAVGNALKDATLKIAADTGGTGSRNSAITNNATVASGDPVTFTASFASIAGYNVKFKSTDTASQMQTLSATQTLNASATADTGAFDVTQDFEIEISDSTSGKVVATITVSDLDASFDATAATGSGGTGKAAETTFKFTTATASASGTDAVGNTTFKGDDTGLAAFGIKDIDLSSITATAGDEIKASFSDATTANTILKVKVGNNEYEVDLDDLDGDGNNTDGKASTALAGQTVTLKSTAAGAAATDVIKVTFSDTAADIKVGNDKTNTADAIAATKIGTAQAAGGAQSEIRLRIGDTADSYNDLTVKIKSMKQDAIKDITDTAKGGTGLTLDKLSVAKLGDADTAMKALKGMINYVSDARGELGATQNRLDHTINNLATMQENIQDAEATIRDVDVAEEMMKYTKNNILVQSAQAMLAQANQLPQGVLQLLG